MPGGGRPKGSARAGRLGRSLAVAITALAVLAIPAGADARPVAKEVAEKPASEIKQLRKRGRTCLVTGKAAPPPVRSAKPSTRKKVRVSTCGASGGQARGDFNNDGFADLAIGSPGEDVGTVADAGTVTVVYGSANGLNLTGNAQLFDQVALNTPNGGALPGDRFGSALASGDFDGDGFSDLAVGAPGDEIPVNPPRDGVGEVDIIFGSASGLSAARKQVLLQQAGPGITTISSLPLAGDNLGGSLAWGQFGGGPEADLAVGIPGDFGQGSVAVMLGSPSGLVQPNPAQVLSLDSIFGATTEQDFAGFGAELTGGDFDGDGYADLAIGASSLDLNPPPGSPGDDIAGASIRDAGAVVVLPGSEKGLVVNRALFLRQGRDGLSEQPERSDRFGSAVTAGDLDGDGFADLAIGASRETVDGLGVGSVQVMFGSAGGLTSAGNRLITPAATTFSSFQFSEFGAAWSPAICRGTASPISSWDSPAARREPSDRPARSTSTTALSPAAWRARRRPGTSSLPVFPARRSTMRATGRR